MAKETEISWFRTHWILTAVSLFILIVFVLYLSGGNRNTIGSKSIIETIPAVQTFLSENHNAEVKEVFFSQETDNEKLKLIKEDCGEQINEVPDHYVTITKDNTEIKIYLNKNGDRVLCWAALEINEDNESIIDFNLSASVIEIQQKAEQMLQENICNLLPTEASRLPSDMLEVGVKAPSNLENGLVITFPSYYLWTYNNETYYNCFTYGTSYGDSSTKECLIPFTADLMDESNNKITNETGAIRLTFEGVLEELKPNPDYIQPTQDGVGLKNYQQVTKIITSTFTRTGCELQIDRSCEVPEGSSFCGQCSYSTINPDELSYRGQCATCPSGTYCSGGSGSKYCTKFNCVSNTQNINTVGTNPQNYFVSCSNCQTGSYRSYNYNSPDYYNCNYYSRLCTQNRCLDKRTNCG